MAVSYNIKVFIADKNGKYVDFTDFLKRRGVDKLVDISSIKHATESKAVGGVFLSTMGDLKMNNADGFWDDPDKWVGTMKTTDGSTAQWNYSKNGREVNLQKSRVKVTVETLLDDGTVREDDIGTFEIADVATDGSGYASIKLVSLANALKKIDAAKVRDGKKWYESRPVVFLMKELLKLQFADSSGNLPDDFSFPDVISIPTFDGSRVFSVYGRPPEWDGTEWREDGLTCRALVWSYDDIVGKGLFLGCDNELWFYQIETDTYTKIGEVDSSENIKRLWINTADSNKIIGAAWADPSSTSKTTTVRLIEYDGSTFSSGDTISDVFTGEYSYRDGDEIEVWTDGTKYFESRYLGTFTSEYKKYAAIQPDTSTEYTVTHLSDLDSYYGGTQNYSSDITKSEQCGENLCIPFSQRPKKLYSEDTIQWIKSVDSLSGGTIGHDYSIVPYRDDGYSISTQFSVGYYIVETTTNDEVDYYGVPLDRSAKPFDLRFSLGQYGCIEFLDIYDSGGIFYATINDSTDNVSYKIYRIGALSTTTLASDYKIDSVTFQATCCATFEDNVYIGGICWDDVGTTDAKSYIVKFANIETITGTSTNSTASYTTLYDSSNPFKTWMVGKTAYNLTDGCSEVITSVASDGSYLKTLIMASSWDSGDSYRIGDVTTTSLLYESTGDTDNIYRTFLDMKYIEAPAGSDYLFISYLNRDKLGTGQFGGVAMHSTSASSNTLTNVWETSSIPTRIAVGESVVEGYFTTDSGVLYKYTSGGTVSIQDSGNPFLDGEPNVSSNLCVVPFDELSAVDTERSNRTEDAIFFVTAPYFPNETQETARIGKYSLIKFDSYLSDRIELAQFEGMSVWDALTNLANIAVGYVIGFDANGAFFMTSKGNSNYTTTLTISSDEVTNNLVSLSKDRGLSDVLNYIKLVPSIVRVADVKKELYLMARTDDEGKTAVAVDDIFVDSTVKYAINLRLICTREGAVNNTYTSLSDSPLFKYQIYESTLEVRTVGSASAGDNTITVASTFRGGESAFNSDDTPNFIDNAVNVYDFITIIDSDTQNEQNIKITNISGNVLTLEDALDYDVPSGSMLEVIHSPYTDEGIQSWSDEGVGSASVATTGTTVYINSIEYLATYTVISNSEGTLSRITDIGDWSDSNSGYTLTVTPAISFSADETIKAYYSPSKDTKAEYSYFQISQSGISLKIEPNASNIAKVNFMKGDRITIISDGLILEKSEQSTQIAQDMTSQSLYGKIEFSGEVSKFITRYHARHFARKICLDYKDPHYVLTVTRKLYPLLRFVDSNGLVRIKIYDKKLFKKYYEVITYPRSIEHNLKTGKTTMILRAVSAY